MSTPFDSDGRDEPFLEAYQRALGAVLFDCEPSSSDFAVLGAGRARWLRYRRMVQARLIETVDHAFERTIRVIGRECLHSWTRGFFAERGPRSPYLRDIPGEVLAYLEGFVDVAGRWPGPGPAVPAFVLDLMRYEWAELETAYTPDLPWPGEVVALSMDLPAALTPAHRILRLAYPVHRLDLPDDPSANKTSANETSGSAAGAVDPDRCETGTMLPKPTALCLYRDPNTHDVRTLELTEVTANLLELLEPIPAKPSERLTLAEATRRAAVRNGAVIDQRFVGALSEVLADFVERGLLCGSLACPGYDDDQGPESLDGRALGRSSD